jgi:hypothetical protein
VAESGDISALNAAIHMALGHRSKEGVKRLLGLSREQVKALKKPEQIRSDGSSAKLTL